MNSNTTAGVAIAGHGAPYGERLARAVQAAAGRGLRRGPRLLLWLGAVLQPLGGALILLGWTGAANSTDVWEQVPYLISGGLLGLAMVVVGGFCYFSYWQTEGVHALRRQVRTDEQVLETLERIEALLAASVAASGPARTRGRTRTGAAS